MSYAAGLTPGAPASSPFLDAVLTALETPGSGWAASNAMAHWLHCASPSLVFAQLHARAGVSHRWIRDQVRLLTTFPPDVQTRFPALSPTHARFALQVAHRFPGGVESDPLWWAAQAQRGAWSVRTLRSYQPTTIPHYSPAWRIAHPFARNRALLQEAHAWLPSLERDARWFGRSLVWHPVVDGAPVATPAVPGSLAWRLERWNTYYAALVGQQLALAPGSSKEMML